MSPSELSPEIKYRLLLEISQKISVTLDLGEVLSHLIDTVRSFVSYDAAGIFILNLDELRVTHGRTTNVIAGMALRGFADRAFDSDPMLRSGKGIVGWVIGSGERLIVPDVRLDGRYVEGRSDTLSEVAVPIMINQRVVGALNLESDRLASFTEADADLLQFFASAAAISIEKAILHGQLLEKRRIESQLEVARGVQSSLLPKHPPRIPGYDIAGINLPTWQVGGDYYDFVPFPNSHCGIAIADVSGKGVPSALIMATFRAALRTQVRNDFELFHIIEAVNGLLSESLGDAEFVTAVYGVLDPAEGRFIYTNCGHNPPLLLRAGGTTELLERGGMALGIFPDNRYETEVVTLAPGDSLVLYTDGVIEIEDRSGAEFGPERLERLLRRRLDNSAEDMIQAVVRATRRFAGAEAYPDDFTLVILKRTSAESS